MKIRTETKQHIELNKLKLRQIRRMLYVKIGGFVSYLREALVSTFYPPELQLYIPYEMLTSYVEGSLVNRIIPLAAKGYKIVLVPMEEDNINAGQGQVLLWVRKQPILRAKLYLSTGSSGKRRVEIGNIYRITPAELRVAIYNIGQKA